MNFQFILVVILFANSQGNDPSETTETTVEVSRPAIGHMNTTMSVSCSLLHPPSGNLTTTWTRKSDGKEIADSETGFTVTTVTGKNEETLTLTIDKTVNTRDDSYECKFEKEDGSQSWSETANVYLFIVTPHGATVDNGDSATLSCVMTDIVKNLTVTWENGKGSDVNDLQGYSFVEGINVKGTQTSTLTIEEAKEDETFTCTLYPYDDQPYHTDVKLKVDNSGRALELSTLLTAFLFIWSSL